MKRLIRLSPEAAGRLMRRHSVAEALLIEQQRYLTEFTRRVRETLGTEALWQLQADTRNAIALAELQQEVSA